MPSPFFKFKYEISPTSRIDESSQCLFFLKPFIECIPHISLRLWHLVYDRHLCRVMENKSPPALTLAMIASNKLHQNLSNAILIAIRAILSKHLDIRNCLLIVRYPGFI